MRPRALVVVADIVDSRGFQPRDRKRLQERIIGLAKGSAAFRFTGGDEFEWRLPGAPSALDALLMARVRLLAGSRDAPRARLRCGLGLGEVAVTSEAGPYAEDGSAYHRARAAFGRVQAARVRRHRSPLTPFEPAGSPTLLTALDDGVQDPLRDALLGHMDQLMLHWTAEQTEAVALLLEGKTYAAIGEMLGVSPQTVHKRARNARLDLFLSGHAALKLTWSLARAP